MGAFRSELEAARARIQTLEAAVERAERERARVDAARRGPRSRTWLWLGLIGPIAGAVLLGVWSAPARAPLFVDAPPKVPAPARQTLPLPAPQPSSLAGLAGLAGLGAIHPSAAYVDPAVATQPALGGFVGQYWTARVTRTRPGGPSLGAECLITLEAAEAYDGPGTATVTCGDTTLHRTSVMPPWIQSDGVCWFTGRELRCAPPTRSIDRQCWISTEARSATCQRDIDLRIEGEMRDPRVRLPRELP